MRAAISYISATLGEPFEAATTSGLHWSACGRRMEDGTRGYPVGIEAAGPESVKLTVSFSQAQTDHATKQKLYSIIGWGHYHGAVVVWD